MITNRNIPIVSADDIETFSMRIRGTVSNPIFTMRFNSSYLSSLSESGKQVVVFHEYLHAYLILDGNLDSGTHHNAFINSPDYLQGMKDIFPN